MIDKVTLYLDDVSIKDIEVRNLYKVRCKESEGLGLENYRKFYGYIGNGTNQIDVEYYPSSERLRLKGRLVNVKDTYNRVYNYDDYLVKREEPEVIGTGGIDDIITLTNKELNNLLGTTNLDVRKFTVSYIEICFNIWLDENNLIEERLLDEEVNLVERYIDIFRNIYKTMQRLGKRKSYTLYTPRKVLQNETDDYGSFYLKTLTDERNKQGTTRVINFYNKKNQLENLEKESRTRLRDRERELSENLLRLEVQLFSQYLRENFGDKHNRPFNKFLSLPLAYEVLKKEYSFFIGNPDLDFYSYHKAKKVIEESDKLSERERKNLLNSILKRYSNNKWESKVTRKKYNDKLERLGIHPIFIPSPIVKEYGINYLPSPMKLLDEKLDRYLADAIDSKLFKLENYTL